MGVVDFTYMECLCIVLEIYYFNFSRHHQLFIGLICALHSAPLRIILNDCLQFAETDDLPHQTTSFAPHFGPQDALIAGVLRRSIPHN